MVFKRWIVLVIVALCASTGAGVRADQTPHRVFQEAATYYQSESWQAAADSFAAFVAESPQAASVPTALFYQAEARLQLEQYAQAQELFQQYLACGSTSDRNRARAEFQVGKTAWMLGQYDLARERLTSFTTNNSAHRLASVAKQHLAELTVPMMFDRDPWLAADELLANGLVEPALRAYLRIASLERQSPRGRQAWLSAARCYDLIGEGQEANEIRCRYERDVTVGVATTDQLTESQLH